MKLLSLLSIAATALVAQATAPTDIFIGFGGIGYGIYKFSVDKYFYRGIVLGLQQDQTNVDSQCFNSYETLEENILQLPSYVVSLVADSNNQNSAISAFVDNVWYRPATYFKLTKRGSEVGSVFFNLYNMCFLDDLIIAIGKTVNSFSGQFNTLANMFVVGLNLLNFDDVDNDIVNMYEAATAASPTDAEIQDFGRRFGMIFTLLFNVQVPEVQYNDF